MQAFINAWIAQARAHRISCELVIVEWNPDPSRAPLKDALRWPAEFGPCVVRFIEVPPELHRRYRNAAALPLHQMVAKNVGIRRARGKFVLAANIDLLFSSELAAFLGAQQLQPGCMYRLDRYDVMSGVPVDAPVEEQLAYCRTHLLRVNTRHGTFPLTPKGEPASCKLGIALPSSGVRFASGWYPPERMSQGTVYRWAGKDAEVLLGAPPSPDVPLCLDIGSGPSLRGRPLQLKLKTPEGRILFEDAIAGRKRLHILLPNPAPARIFLQATEAGEALPADPRILTMQVFQLDWGPTLRKRRGLRFWLTYPAHVMHLFASQLSQERTTFTLPFRNPGAVRRIAGIYAASGGITGILRHGITRPKSATEVQDPAGLPPRELLHTTASGDFTLMAREHWFDLRGYPEFDIYPMHLDSILCYAAYHAGVREEILPDPMRIYHIEHALGSGWTPEGEAILFGRLAAQGVPHIRFKEMLLLASQMGHLQSPMIFNHEDWGLANFELKESTVPA